MFSTQFTLSPNPETGIRVLHVVDELVAVLADEVLFVVAGDVVPHDAVAVEVVQNRQTGLVVLALQYMQYIVAVK